MRMPLYYDYACPWAYLGSSRAEAYFRDLGVEIDFKPIHLATLREPTAGQMPAAGERKSAWYASDIQAWSEMIGGDVDTTAAMAGAMLGAYHGRGALPAEWTALLNDQGRYGEAELVELTERCYHLRHGSR